MTSFTRRQVLEILELEESFLVALEDEAIVQQDAPAPELGYSDAMLERIRVASELVRELDVNLPGTAVILHMREEMEELRRRLAALLEQLKNQRGGGSRE